MKHSTGVHTAALAIVFLATLGVASAEVEGPRRIVLPEKLSLSAMLTPDDVLVPWAQIETKFKAGDPDICNWVAKTMEAAKRWADQPDSYYMGLFRPETLFGRSTITCPFHPHMFVWLPFDWDPDKPWRLTCAQCKKEGRKPDYYPNELYPDNGKGCRPTDEVWRKTHTPEWSAKYRIPWEKWDGHTHGHVDGHTFFFLGCAQFRIFFEMNYRRDILGTMCKAYVFGSRLYPAGSDERKLASVCARKSRLIMVTMARTIMGDGYLQDVLGMDRKRYRQAVDSLAIGPDGKALAHKEYPGYERRDISSDHSANDPEHPLEALRPSRRKRLTIFPDTHWNMWANMWLRSYTMIQDSFTPDERQAKLTGLVERLLLSKTGDAERLKKRDRSLKRGVMEYGMRPYDLSMRGNLTGSTAWSNLNLGLTLKDREIVRNVGADIWFNLRNYFTGDGLGYETSPHYTQVAIGNISPSLASLNGMKEGFGPGDPFWDEKTGSLRPYKDPVLAAAAYSPLLSVLPDGRCAVWVDSWITEEPDMPLMIEKVANAVGGIPERFTPWLNVTKDDRGKLNVSLKKELTLPSYVIGSNRLAVMRTGLGQDQTFVSVDWSRRTGHSHDGPFNLLLYGARHEMLFDQGYLNNITPTQAWMNSAESHNTALVRSADGNAADCFTWRGSLRFFADTPHVQAVEVAEENPDLLRKVVPAGQKAIYQRTVVLIPAKNPYVVDIFRLHGGATHDYYVHSLGENLAVTGATLKAEADRKKSLYDISGFTYATDSGARVITGISRAKTDGPFTATWSNIRDWRSGSAEMDADAVTRVRMLGSPGTEILVGDSFGQRYIDGPDVAERVTVMCVRRKAGDFRDVPDAFVAVIDATRGKVDNIKQLRQLQVLSGDKAGVGVKITRAGGIDYVLSTTHDDTATTFVDPDTKKKITLTGRLGVIRIETGKGVSLVLVQGKHLGFGSKAVSSGSASLNGRLVGFNNRNMVLTVESDAAIPTGTDLAGRVLIVRHACQADAFTIRRIDRLAPGRYGIAVADMTSLSRCMVRVKSIAGESVAIEPTPILYRENDFFVYREDQAGQAVLLAPYKGETKEVFDEHGTTMGRYTTATLVGCKGIKPGMRLLISALQIGRDTVSIPAIRSTVSAEAN